MARAGVPVRVSIRPRSLARLAGSSRGPEFTGLVEELPGTLQLFRTNHVSYRRHHQPPGPVVPVDAQVGRPGHRSSGGDVSWTFPGTISGHLQRGGRIGVDPGGCCGKMPGPALRDVVDCCISQLPVKFTAYRRGELAVDR